MAARLMHDHQGHITAQPYGVGEQAIYSISRRGLNEMLLNELDKLGKDKVEVRHNAKVVAVKQDGTLTYRNTEKRSKDAEEEEVTLRCRFVLGADGA
jgi:kynurenine 3-monooxygenase